MKLAGRTRNVEGASRRRAHRTTLAAAVLAVSALAAALPALSGCAGFQGTRQVPLLVPVETSARRHAGPWLTPRFGPEPAVIVSRLTGQPAETRLFAGMDPGSLEERRGEGRGRLHRITLPALEPGRRFCKKRLYTFAAPDWNLDQAEIIVPGDLQPRAAFARRGGRLMAEAVTAAGADLVVQLGDVAGIGAFASHWLAALANLAVFASGIPMVGVIGNHDYYGDPGRNFRSLFPHPSADPHGAFWSFEVAGAHFVMVDCFEEDGRVSGRQKAWVEADLAAAADGGARYLFVVLHLTPLTTGTSRAGTELEGWLLPLADRPERALLLLRRRGSVPGDRLRASHPQALDHPSPPVRSGTEDLGRAQGLPPALGPGTLPRSHRQPGLRAAAGRQALLPPARRALVPGRHRLARLPLWRANPALPPHPTRSRGGRDQRPLPLRGSPGWAGGPAPPAVLDPGAQMVG